MKVKIERIKRGLRQKDLCEICKISPKKMVEIERGIYDTVTISQGMKIATVLDTTFEELFLNKEV